jgi:hypothetical protein
MELEMERREHLAVTAETARVVREQHAMQHRARALRVPAKNGSGDDDDDVVTETIAMPKAGLVQKVTGTRGGITRTPSVRSSRVGTTKEQYQRLIGARGGVPIVNVAPGAAAAAAAAAADAGGGGGGGARRSAVFRAPETVKDLTFWSDDVSSVHPEQQLAAAKRASSTITDNDGSVLEVRVGIAQHARWLCRPLAKCSWGIHEYILVCMERCIVFELDDLPLFDLIRLIHR